MLIEEHIKGTLYVPIMSGGSFIIKPIDFTEHDIIRDSVSVTSKCCDDKTFSIGGVRPAELSIKICINDSEINAYTLYGAKIRLYSAYHSAPVPDDKWLLRGEFWVTSVKRNRKIYSLSASDALVWLDSGSYLEGSEKSIDDDSIYKICSSAIRGLDSNFGDGILKYVNNELRNKGIDEIKSGIRNDIVNNMVNNLGYAIIPAEISGGYGVRSPREYASYIAELAAGCIQMLPCPYEPDVCRLYITPFGYRPGGDSEQDKAMKGAWNSPVEIPYDSIELDSCDVADFVLYNNLRCARMYDGFFMGSGAPPLQYCGNFSLDFTDNVFLCGRYYHSIDRAKLDLVFNGIGDQFGNITIRPFSLRCHRTFSSVKELPKLGQKIRIEEKPNVWKDSIITKMVWKFRSGWEFGCAGADSRVLSQAARRTLASRAEEKAKAFANIISRTRR